MNSPEPLSRRASSVIEDVETGIPTQDFSRRNEQTSRVVNVALFINFLANVFLLLAKVIASLTSSSLSIIASLIDSALDFLSTIIIYTVSRIVAQRDWKSDFNFPVGKARLEPIGVLVFSVIMIVSFLQVIVEAVQRLMDEERQRHIVQLSPQAIIIMIATGISLGSSWLTGSCGQVNMLLLVHIDPKFWSASISSGCDE